MYYLLQLELVAIGCAHTEPLKLPKIRWACRTAASSANVENIVRFAQPKPKRWLRTSSPQLRAHAAAATVPPMKVRREQKIDKHGNGRRSTSYLASRV